MGQQHAVARRRWQPPARAVAVASFLAAVLTEIYLCGVCFCQKQLRRNGGRA
jgi:hypothetical protein